MTGTEIRLGVGGGEEGGGWFFHLYFSFFFYINFLALEMAIGTNYIRNQQPFLQDVFIKA